MAVSRGARKVRQFREEPLRPGDPHLRVKGRLFIIGGHEDKDGDRQVLCELAELVGEGKLVVSTVASEMPDEMWRMYEPAFRRLGVPHVHHLQVESRDDASSVRCMAILEKATAVFFTGGDQLRITSMIGDTPLYSRIHEILLEGGIIAGTSAGAAIMSETMMVGGNGESSHRINEGLRLAPGFGFAKDMVVDQHFAERGRIGRLLGVVGQNPRILGVGIDEDTGILMRPSRDFRVIGSGGVTIIDGKTVTHTNVAEEDTGSTMALFGATLHVLAEGDAFDLNTRIPADRPKRPKEATERKAASRNGNGKRRRQA